jgi:hypothetical protein
MKTGNPLAWIPLMGGLPFIISPGLFALSEAGKIRVVRILQLRKVWKILRHVWMGRKYEDSIFGILPLEILGEISYYVSFPGSPEKRDYLYNRNY